MCVKPDRLGILINIRSAEGTLVSSIRCLKWSSRNEAQHRIKSSHGAAWAELIAVERLLLFEAFFLALPLRLY
jgi:hypothetical protein